MYKSLVPFATSDENIDRILGKISISTYRLE